MVDKICKEPLSLAKAKSEGIRMAQLPLDRYLQWNIGTKSLAINQVINILLDIKSTGDWNIALKHVPQRKVRQFGEPVQDRRQLLRRGTLFDPRKRNRFY